MQLFESEATPSSERYGACPSAAHLHFKGKTNSKGEADLISNSTPVQIKGTELSTDLKLSKGRLNIKLRFQGHSLRDLHLQA